MEEPAIPLIISKTSQDKEKKKKKDKEGKEELSIVKVELSLYRAQMAMVRTTTTMTTFGFALYKLLEEKVRDGRIRPVLKIISPKAVALTLFFAGFTGLATYSIKHIRTLKKLNLYNRRIYFSGVMLMSYVILLLTLALFLGTLLNT
jgi:uncharacterized membrane protein YidH (DUF202 family)